MCTSPSPSPYLPGASHLVQLEQFFRDIRQLTEDQRRVEVDLPSERSDDLFAVVAVGEDTGSWYEAVYRVGYPSHHDPVGGRCYISYVFLIVSIITVEGVGAVLGKVLRERGFRWGKARQFEWRNGRSALIISYSFFLCIPSTSCQKSFEAILILGDARDEKYGGCCGGGRKEKRTKK